MMGLDAFGNRLRRLLVEKHITQKDLAAALGVSPTAVGNWIKGGSEISLDRLKALAHYLDVSWLWLRYGDEALEEARRQLGERRETGILNENRRKYIADMMAHQETVRRALDLANMVIWEWNLVTGDIAAYGNIKELYCIDHLTHIDQLMPHILPHSKARLNTVVEEMIAHNAPSDWTFKYRQPGTDKIIWIGTRSRILRDEQGTPYKMVGIASDVSETKKTQNRLQLALEAANAGLFAVDLRTGDVTYCNAREAELLGLPGPEALKTATDFIKRVPEVDHVCLPANGPIEQKRQHFAPDERIAYTHRVQDETGTILRTIRTYAIFHDHDDDGVVDTMVGVSVDAAAPPHCPPE